MVVDISTTNYLESSLKNGMQSQESTIKVEGRNEMEVFWRT